ncbi:cytoplasmic tRNA 2-thiolation protein 2-A [Patella vulgata]|uniref:cytoplasmic tRNA 2-thiolation protein 2-A n=1 Tax=Patella vulgata TaxID=6465 RepID=UPI0024A8F4F5|nr:cytoplasmic tRNA 2-thiolation protein 2-A [Patella vulgata]
MCSVADGDEIAKPRDKNTSVGRKCMKCEEDGFIITRVNDAFCRKCFTVYVVHKFRSAIGKSKLVRDGDVVLLAYSGGPSSTALLHLVQEGLSPRAHKKLRFKPVILHIDESASLDLSAEIKKENLMKICERIKTTGYQGYISSIEQGLNISGLTPDSPPLYIQLDEQDKLMSHCQHKMAEFTDVLSSMKSLTAKEDFIKTLRTQLILSIAKQMGYSKIMTADTNSRLAVNILSDIAQGRGSQVSYETGFYDSRYKDMMILRPIRDLSIKEVAVYDQMNDLHPVFIPTLTTKGSYGSSIDRLTENFVTGLQADYLSTVSNIVRTGEKLGIEENGYKDICTFCQSPLDTDVGQASALVAVEFSQKLSKEGRPSAELIGEPEHIHTTNDGSHSSQLRYSLFY